MAREQIEAAVWVGCDNKEVRDRIVEAIAEATTDRDALGVPKGTSVFIQMASSELKGHSLLDVMKDMVPGIAPAHVGVKRLMEAPIGNTESTIGDAVGMLWTTGAFDSQLDNEKYQDVEDPQEQIVLDLMTETVHNLRGEV